MARDWLKKKIPPVRPRTPLCWEESGTFLLCFLPDVRKRRPEILCREVPGFLGYYDGDEFRVAVAVSLSSLLYVRFRPREALLRPSSFPRTPGSALIFHIGRGRKDPIVTTLSHLLSPYIRPRQVLPLTISMLPHSFFYPFIYFHLVNRYLFMIYPIKQ